VRIGWIGFHEEGLPALRALLEIRAPIVAVLTLEAAARERRSGHADYAPLCAEFGVPLYTVRNINDADALALLTGLHLDLAFVIGWSQIVGSEALRLVRGGMIGAHASLLPRDRGRAPINWALIRGYGVTGNSLIWLAEGVDSGDIIDQTEIRISPFDTCATLYDRVAESNRDMLLRQLPALLAGTRVGRPQAPNSSPPLPARRPADGEIDWSQSARAVYDFVRALTRPYPGAFSSLEGSQFVIWSCAVLPVLGGGAGLPGQVLGPVFSPIEAACGQLVACGHGALVLLEVEDEHGTVISGRALAGQQWERSIWRASLQARAGGGGASG
jgi:methionyl-tRNA formyltransferase